MEYHPALVTGTPEAFLERLRELSTRFMCIPISGDLDLLTLTLQSAQRPPPLPSRAPKPRALWARNSRNSLRHPEGEWRAIRDKPGLIIWGGVATPEAAAAFLCSGAKGVVFESLHWQTDLISANRNLRQRLSRLRPEHTAGGP